MIFATPILLIGLIAAGIPFLLHMISKVRAREQKFPTLRFLRQSLEKTSRRRRVQNWLLLLLRSLLLAVLAMAVAEPISRATGGWGETPGQAAVILLDNSFSMAAVAGGNSRFARAKKNATAILSGDRKPSLAGLLRTTGPIPSGELTRQLDTLRKDIDTSTINYAAASLEQRFARVIDLLAGQSNPRRAIYLFCDLQRLSLEPLLKLPNLIEAKDMHLFILNCATGVVSNVGVTDLKVSGRAIVDAPVEFHVTILNSSPTPRTVDLVFRVEGSARGRRQQVIKKLAPGGKNGDSAVVRFGHRFSRAGYFTGEVRLMQEDDLLVDNVRRFCLDVGERVRVLVVRGPVTGAESFVLDPAMMLGLALDWRNNAQEEIPWPIRAKTIDADKFAPDSLKNVDTVFFCEVPSFSTQTAQAIGQFAATGGTVVFFLGPGVRVENYNQRFFQADGGLLPGKLAAPVGQVGSGAEALGVDKVAMTHPLFQGLFENTSDYLKTLTQRYFKLEVSPGAGEVLMRLANGDPLLVERRVGEGRILWCTTTASPRWTTFPTTGLFLPVMVRAALMGGQRRSVDESYTASLPVTIRLPQTDSAGEKIRVTLPAQPAKPKFRDVTADEKGVVRFVDTHDPGVYRWEAVGVDAGAAGLLQESAAGAFVVNPYGPESQLDAYTSGELKAALTRRGLQRVYIGSSLEEIQTAATKDSQGRNFWDVLIVLVVVLLVAEAVVANRRSPTPTAAK